MKRIGKMLAVIVGAGLLVFVGAMFGPRTAHAITATMVQVVNTTTTAIPAVQAPASSTLYSHVCLGSQFFPSGDSTSTCTFPDLPAGQTLIVETVSLVVDTNGTAPEVAYIGPADEIASGVEVARLFIPMIQQADTSTGNHNYTGASAARVYFHSAPGCAVTLANATAQQGAFRCTIGGYLVPTD
jgi:hypothetical protein